MSLNPYEVRLETLKLAQIQAHEKWSADWAKAAKQAEINENASLLTEVPDYPTTDMILEDASKLRKFVDGTTNYIDGDLHVSGDVTAFSPKKA